jgi:hypothetical protein
MEQQLNHRTYINKQNTKEKKVRATTNGGFKIDLALSTTNSKKIVMK